MRSRLLMAMVIAAGLARPGVIGAQDPEPSQEEFNQLKTLTDSTPPAEAPGDEVMQPTKHGIRLTPGLARTIGRAWVNEALVKDKGMILNDDQQGKIAEALARRFMQAGHTHGKDVGPFLEFIFESIGPDGPRPATPDQAKLFAERARPTMPAWRDVFGHFSDDCRPFLDSDQLREVEQIQKKLHKAMDRFEQRLNRWAEGQLKENEDPFDDLDEPDEPATQPDDGNRPGEPKKPQELQRAEARAMRGLREIGVDEWRGFFRSVRETFKLTDEQAARGTQLLQDYTQKAKAIMSPGWWGKAKRNRTLYHLRDVAGQQPLAPWLYHLDREYADLEKPIQELGRAFRRDVLALVTREQREAFVNELYGFAVKHGMTAEEADFRFPTTRPE